MNVTDRDVANLRRISEKIFGDRDYIEITEVKETGDDVMVRVASVGEGMCGTRNAFAGSNLRKYHENGYAAVAVGGGNDSHSAWFERADAVDFGTPDPDGEYDLSDDWSAVVAREYLRLHVDGSTVAHVKRDGWTLDEYVLHKVLPSEVTQELEDIGFEQGDVGDE